MSDDKVSIDNLLPGQSADSSILDVTVLSNNPYGYKLTGTVGSTDYTADALYNNGDNTKTFTSIGYGNNKTSLSDFDNDTWGYSYSLDGGNTWIGNGGATGYTGLPLYSTSNTATFLDTDDISAVEGDTMKFKIGAKASSTKESGEYNNTINFVATGYSFPLYTITYNANGGTVTPTSEQVRGTSVTLPTPTNGSKIFGGWCDSAIVSSACTGNTYQAGTSYTPTGNIDFTAIWINPTVTFDDAFASAGKSKTGNYYRMDDMNSSICETVSIEQVGTLVDTRGTSGTQAYTVAKLKDGKCWMTQNLRLTYNSSTTLNVSNGVGGTTTWKPERATGTGSGTDCTISSWSADHNNPYSATCNDATNGVYYDWTAAIASNDSSSITAEGTVVNTSICPKGWKLPQNAEGAGSFYTLYQYYNSSSAMRSAPVNFVLSGNYYGYLRYVGSYGYYWSSTVSDSNYAYILRLTSSLVSPQSIYYRYNGYSVRCVSI